MTLRGDPQRLKTLRSGFIPAVSAVLVVAGLLSKAADDSARNVREPEIALRSASNYFATVSSTPTSKETYEFIRGFFRGFVGPEAVPQGDVSPVTKAAFRSGQVYRNSVSNDVRTVMTQYGYKFVTHVGAVSQGPEDSIFRPQELSEAWWLTLPDHWGFQPSQTSTFKAEDILRHRLVRVSGYLSREKGPRGTAHQIYATEVDFEPRPR